jgi:hypothetical protein
MKKLKGTKLPQVVLFEETKTKEILKGDLSAQQQRQQGWQPLLLIVLLCSITCSPLASIN